MLRHDRKELLLFAPLQGEFAAGVRRRHPGLEQADSMVWVERGNGHERVFIRSDAALRAAAHLGGLWRAAAAVRIVPRPLRDAIYRFIARHRHRFAGGPVCVLPTAAERERFLP